MNWLKTLKTVSKDTASTVAGALVSGAVAASAAYLQGQVTKEALCASAIIGIGGWYFQRGNKEPVMK